MSLTLPFAGQPPRLPADFFSNSGEPPCALQKNDQKKFKGTSKKTQNEFKTTFFRVSEKVFGKDQNEFFFGPLRRPKTPRRGDLSAPDDANGPRKQKLVFASSGATTDTPKKNSFWTKKKLVLDSQKTRLKLVLDSQITRLGPPTQKPLVQKFVPKLGGNSGAPGCQTAVPETNDSCRLAPRPPTNQQLNILIRRFVGGGGGAEWGLYSYFWGRGPQSQSEKLKIFARATETPTKNRDQPQKLLNVYIFDTKSRPICFHSGKWSLLTTLLKKPPSPHVLLLFTARNAVSDTLFTFETPVPAAHPAISAEFRENFPPRASHDPRKPETIRNHHPDADVWPLPFWIGSRNLGPQNFLRIF